VNVVVGFICGLFVGEMITIMVLALMKASEDEEERDTDAIREQIENDG